MGRIGTNRVLWVAIAGFLLVLGIGIGALATPKAGDQFSVAYIDANVLIAKDPDFVKANGEIQAKAKAAQQELDAKAKTADKAQQAKLLADYQAKLDADKAALTGEATRKLKAQIHDTAARLGYDLVLDSRSVLVGGTDLTNEVLKAAGGTTTVGK